MRVAIVHDWLDTYAGAEKALEQMLHCFPEADLYSLVDFLPPDQRGFIRDKLVRTSFIQKLPFARCKSRQYLPLMPLAIEQFDLSAYELVISSSHAIAKGVLTSPEQFHVCYCYTPVRYAWHLQPQYLKEYGLERGVRSWIARWVLHRVRLWDYRTAHGVDEFVAISHYISRRIWKVYRREAAVIYPPVDVNTFQLHENKEDFYVTVSRMTPYKKVEHIVEAFAAMPERKLVVIGDGWQMGKVRAMASRNTEILGYQDRGVVREYLSRARAFVFAAEEDFGISPVEAQACGTPVIALGRGGVVETVRGLDSEQPTGVFFDEVTPEKIREAVQVFERNSDRITPRACRQNALRYSAERFREQFKGYVLEHLARFQRDSTPGGDTPPPLAAHRTKKTATGAMPAPGRRG